MGIREDWQTYLGATGTVLNPYQEEVANVLLGLPKEANLTWCRDSGKTFIMGNICLFLQYRYGFDIIVAAPVLGQSSHIMEEAGKAAYRLCNKDAVHASTATVKVKGRPGKMVAVTGSINAQKQGAKGQIVVIDEKQDVLGSQAAEDFIGMKTRGGCMWLVGVGGGPQSAGEMFKSKGCYISELPWQEYAKWDTDYYDEKVEPAKRLMLPEEFAAHYECKALDTSAHLLVPHINPHDPAIKMLNPITVIGVDWGKRLDRSVATVTDVTANRAYIKAWLIPTGNYDEQMKQLVPWLKEVIEYDYVIAETNGVGDGCSDILIAQMKDPRGYESPVQGVFVTQPWKTRLCKKINTMASIGTLTYNADDPLADLAIAELTKLNYKMLDTKQIKPDHSDILSSLMLSLDEPQMAYL